MKKWVLPFFCAVGLFVGAAVLGHEQRAYQPEKLTHVTYSQEEQSVGKIELVAPSVDGELGHGTGVFVSPTVMLTAGHVVDALQKPNATDQEGNPIQDVHAVVKMDNGDTYNVVKMGKKPGVDIGYLVVDHPYKGWIPKISCDDQPMGTVLITIGNPARINFTLVKLIVSGGHQKQMDKVENKRTDNIDNDLLKLVQGIILPGQSGSPVFDGHGNLVGIVIMQIVSNGGNSTGFGVYISTHGTCKYDHDALTV